MPSPYQPKLSSRDVAPNFAVFNWQWVWVLSVCNVHVFSFLPERRRQIRTHVSLDVVVFHFLALAFSNEIKDVKVLEISTEVISEVDAVGRVAACGSPVGGVSL